MSLAISPLTLREAYAYVCRHHRHHRPPQGALFAIAASEEGEIHGVVIVGRPLARMLDDEWTAEMTRLCTDGTRNAPSMLSRAAWRTARAMGYRRLITYTLEEEGGASLRGAGWTLIGETRAQSWHRASRPRVDLCPAQKKLRWEIVAA